MMREIRVMASSKSCTPFVKSYLTAALTAEIFADVVSLYAAIACPHRLAVVRLPALFVQRRGPHSEYKIIRKTNNCHKNDPRKD